MSESASDTARILALAQAQRPDPAGWSLAVDLDWIQRFYFGHGVSRKLDALPNGELGASAAIRVDGEDGPGVCVVTSMLRPGCEQLWAAQLAWIEAQMSSAEATTVWVVSECLTDAEKTRWDGAGYDLVFEELAMAGDLSTLGETPVAWIDGARILEWSPAAAAASFDVYEAAFRDRPGFPAWSRAEWIARMSGGDDFLPEASFCVLRDGVPAGFVVCIKGWVDQVGVAPPHRRVGLASALVTEATARMRALGTDVARLHVNANNAPALAAWRRLGFRESGRRGRFDHRVSHSG